MAIKQTRRSVSLSRGHYDKLKRLSDVKQVSMSKLIEHEIDKLYNDAQCNNEIP